MDPRPTRPRRLSLIERSIGRFRKGQGRIIRAGGAYRFIRPIGSGGMGEVWQAEKLGYAQFSKLMAIKRVRRTRITDPRYFEMLLDEARLVANLVHPHIVQVYQLFRTRREVCIVMEHVFGVTLLQVLERIAELGHRLPVDVGCYVVGRICQGLYYAHMKCSRDGDHLGIVHRDICPSNILISYRGIPKLTDFGVAKATTSHVDDEGNVVWGKYPYMAPEAVYRKGTDPRSDIYSLGLVMYEMFTGEIAHDVEGTSELRVLLEEKEEKNLDVTKQIDGFPRRLGRIIQRATAVDPSNRYQSAKDLGTDLEHFMLESFLFPDEERLADYLSGLFPEARKHRWW